MRKCPTCNGTGTLKNAFGTIIKCPDCDNDRYYDPNPGRPNLNPIFWRKCPRCKGKKTLKNAFGTVINCPDCDGQGYIASSTEKPFLNPNVIPCPDCNCRGEIFEPNMGFRMKCYNCDGRGWIYAPLPTSAPLKNKFHVPKITSFDKWMVKKLFTFLFIRPFLLVLSLLKGGKSNYNISWKNYVSLIWWGVFLITPLIVSDLIWMFYCGFYFIILLVIYGALSFFDRSLDPDTEQKGVVDRSNRHSSKNRQKGTIVYFNRDKNYGIIRFGDKKCIFFPNSFRDKIGSLKIINSEGKKVSFIPIIQPERNNALKASDIIFE